MESYIVKSVSEKELFYYFASDAPWPLKDRDLVIRMQISQDSTSGIVRIETNSVNGFVSERENFVRIKNMSGLWVLTPLKSGFVKMEYFLTMELGGIVPDWLINYAMSYGPINTVTSLKKRVKQKNVKSMKRLDFIKEF